MPRLEHIEAVLKAWDDMDLAAQRVANSLPDKLSDSVARMESTRLAAREVIQRSMMALSKEVDHDNADARCLGSQARV